VSRMTVLDFQQRTSAELSSDVQKALTPLEKNLCRLFTRIEIRGKCGRTVPVLVTGCILQAMECLMSYRNECGIRSDNVFMFARPHSDHNMRGTDCLRTTAERSEVAHPERLRSTKLRKHVATLSQVLNLKKNEMDQLAQFMGHSINVHRQFYRLPNNTLQSAHIAKIFLLMEKGQIMNADAIGKSLADSSINQLIEQSKFIFIFFAQSYYGTMLYCCF